MTEKGRQKFWEAIRTFSLEKLPNLICREM